MLDVSLFRNLRFTAASGSVTVAFFALFGFIFLITQYFQFLKGYSPARAPGCGSCPSRSRIGSARSPGSNCRCASATRSIVAAGLTMVGDRLRLGVHRQRRNLLPRDRRRR